MVLNISVFLDRNDVLSCMLVTRQKYSIRTNPDKLPHFDILRILSSVSWMTEMIIKVGRCMGGDCKNVRYPRTFQET